MGEKIINVDNVDLVALFGENNKKFNKLKSYFPKLKLISRGNKIKILGDNKEVERFITLFTADQVGLNVNLGHLNLSAQYHKFDKLQFINRFADRIRAFELSHNDGVKDDHALLQKNGWYWAVIKEPKYKKIYKIFEGRDLKLKSVIKMFGLINQLSKENE